MKSVKEIPRKERPKSVYDNVEYSPNKPPSWQYYRCMSFVIKLFELVSLIDILYSSPSFVFLQIQTVACL